MTRPERGPNGREDAGSSGVRAPTGTDGQRHRLLEAIIAVAAESGYWGVRIGTVTARAGVSRATFYALFGGKEECFHAAFVQHAERLVIEVQASLKRTPRQDALTSAFGVLSELARREPGAFICLTHEAIVAGERMHAERDLLIERVARLIERHAHADPRGPALPDIPVRLLLGSVVRLLGGELRRGALERSTIHRDIVIWADGYRAGDSQRRWSEVAPDAALASALPTPATRMSAPAASPRGRHHLPEQAVSALQRDRILYATAMVMSARGYAGTSVADIVAQAGLSREVFYKHMHDKREALEETVSLFFEQTIAAMAGAFFTAVTEWPERMWRAGQALARMLEGAPAFAEVALIESYAPGADAARIVDEMLKGFCVFLEDGFRLHGDPAAVPRRVADAVTGALVELATTQIRLHRAAEFPALVPLATYIALAPFTGPEVANEFVMTKRRQLLDALP